MIILMIGFKREHEKAETIDFIISRAAFSFTVSTNPPRLLGSPANNASIKMAVCVLKPAHGKHRLSNVKSSWVFHCALVSLGIVDVVGEAVIVSA